MGLRIIYGKPGSGKSTFCFSEISKLVKDEKIYIITPEQFSFTAEQKLMSSIDTKAVINAEVITLSRMAYRVMNEIGGNDATNLSKCGKAMLIYSILNEHKKELKFLGKSDENVEMCVNAITEFKKHNISLEILKEQLNKIESPYLKTKLEDMVLVYNEFQNKIENNYIEETDILNILAENLKNVNFIKDSIIYIDEFAGFTLQEYNVIKELIKIAKKVNITLCIDNLETETNPDKDIYYSNKITLRKLQNLVEENDLKMEKPIELKETYRFKTPEMKFLSENLYNVKSPKYGENVENIQIFLSRNEYSEIEHIAKEIKDLIINQNYRYKDIAIITKDISKYSSLVRAIFNKYKIPVFIDEKKDINQNTIIKNIIAILEILSKRFNKESVIGYVKLGFCPIEEDEIYKLENYCDKWGITYNKWKTDFVYEMNTKTQEIERLNELRKIIIDPLLELQEDIDKEKTAEGITKSLYKFIEKTEMDKKIIQKMEYFKSIDLEEVANEYKKSYKILLDIFDEIIDIFKDEKMTVDQYKKILCVGLKNSNLGEIPGTQDQVIFGDIDRSRTHKVNAVFIIGVNDGVYPSANKDEGFFNDKDREELKNYDIELAKGTLQNLYEDNFNIYKAFTTTEKRLYLSHISSNSEGKTQRPSILINKIKKILPGIEEESEVVNKKYKILNEEITYEELIEQIGILKKRKKMDEYWYQIYHYFKNNPKWKEKLEKDIKGTEYTNVPEVISQENIKKLYGNTLSASVSKLEKYKRCPFSYHLRYGLNLKDKEELQVKAVDTGSFMHEVIDEFFDQMQGEKSELMQLSLDEIQEIVSNIVDEKLSLSKNIMFTATSNYRVLLRRLKVIISRSIRYIIETIVESDFIIEGSEVEFADGKEYRPLEVQLEDGKKIKVTGKIDRIDTAIIDGKRYIRIIDYKSSEKVIEINDISMGVQLQLITYMNIVCSQRNVMPAAILYFPLIDKIISSKGRLTEEELNKKIKKQFKMRGLIVKDVKIIKSNDKNIDSEGSSIINVDLTKYGEVKSRGTDCIDYEEFKTLQKYVNKLIADIGSQIYSGKISISPYKKTTNNETACDYCNYKSICNFTSRRAGNVYHYASYRKTKKEFINEMDSKLQSDNEKVKEKTNNDE